MPAAPASGGRRARSFCAAVAVLGGISVLGCDATPATPPPPPAPTEPTAASVVLSPSDTILVEGEATPLIATVRDSVGAVLADHAVSWRAFPEGIVALSGQGVVQALALGTARVVAQAGAHADTAVVDVRILFRALSAGAAHTCGVTTVGSAYCWGRNLEGRLGDGTLRSSMTPSRVAFAIPLLQVSAGWEFTCGVTAHHTVCWGSNRSGQLGSASKDDALRPVGVANDPSLTAVATYAIHACGISGPGGDAYCWGADWAGQLGDAGQGGRWPHLTAGGLGFVAVDAGGLFSCGLTTPGTAYCWGSNRTGQLGRPDAPSQCTWYDGTPMPCATVPVAVAGGLAFDTIAVGAAQTCALTGAGDPYCWGDNSAGQLGTGSTANGYAPQPVAGGLRLVMISAGDRHTCALDADGAAWCWGDGGGGALGSTTVSEICDGRPCSTVPLAVETSLRFTWLTASRGGTGQHTCGLATDGIAYCWGSNAWGQLGVGVVPTQSAGPLRVYGQPETSAHLPAAAVARGALLR